MKRHRERQRARGTGPLSPEELQNLTALNARNLLSRKSGAPAAREALELAREHGGMERPLGEGDVELAIATLESNGYPTIRAVIAQMAAYSAVVDEDA